jgi:LytS/YehU family sensor histidine kinase
MFTMAWYMNDYSKQEKLVEETRKKQIETELSFLKSQINPHFLFNTLNNLYSLALKKSDTAPEAILKLSVILRYLLYDSNTEEVSFDKEKEIMQAYIDLELLRLADNDQLHFSISADNSCKVPPLLWLPVLENVFKHGTRFISTECFVDYRFMIQNNMLTIYAKNRYKNAAPSVESDKVGGIGLSNLRKRLNILYPQKHKINIMQDEDYYVTEVQVALT